jgi:hypothetical protein
LGTSSLHYRHSEDEADMTALDIEALGRRALHAAMRPVGRKRRCARCCMRTAKSLAASPAMVNNAALFEQDDAGDFTVARLDAHMHAKTWPRRCMLAQGAAR